MRNFLKKCNNPLTFVLLALLGMSLFANFIQHEVNEDLVATNAAWQEAAMPIFQSRMFVAGTEPELVPANLRNALNPCYAFTWLERSRASQVGCNGYGDPGAPVSVRISFLDPEDQATDPDRVLWH